MFVPQQNHALAMFIISLSLLVIIVSSDEQLSSSTTCPLGDQDCIISSENQSSNISSSKRQNNVQEDFFSWNLDEDSLMNALFSNLPKIQAAWENHPFLSKVSFAQPSRIQARPSPLNSIRAVFHNRTSLLKYSGFDADHKNGKDPLISLFSVHNAIEVLSHPHMEHLHDYILGKKQLGFIREQRHHTIEEITNYFHKEGMSVFIENMQKKWKSFGKMTRMLEEELGAAEVTANLWMTPEVLMAKEKELIKESSDQHPSCEGWAKAGECEANPNYMLKNCCASCSTTTPSLPATEQPISTHEIAYQGVDAHWDNRDVIIIQLAGRKRWSVAREPIIHLSNRDTKRELTTGEIEYYASDNRFREFTLCPGDVLYIPRGHIHNASTVAFDTLKRKWEDWDTCPSYPEDLDTAALLAGAAVNTPSIHITFTLAGGFTIEAILHYALYEYFGAGITLKNSVVIPARTCSNPAQMAMGYDVRWQQVLHHALAEVTRRMNDCDNPSYRGIDAKKQRSRECNDTLRQQVPFLLLDNNELKTKGLSLKKQVDVRILKKSYLKAADIFASSASIPKTIDFIRTHVLQPYKDYDVAFRYPYYRPEKDAILCPDDLKRASESALPVLVEDFVLYAKRNFLEVFMRMNQDVKRVRDKNRQRQMWELQRVGQGGEL